MTRRQVHPHIRQPAPGSLRSCKQLTSKRCPAPPPVSWTGRGRARGDADDAVDDVGRNGARLQNRPNWQTVLERVARRDEVDIPSTSTPSRWRPTWTRTGSGSPGPRPPTAGEIFRPHPVYLGTVVPAVLPTPDGLAACSRNLTRHAATTAPFAVERARAARARRIAMPAAPCVGNCGFYLVPEPVHTDSTIRSIGMIRRTVVLFVSWRCAGIAGDRVVVAVRFKFM